MIGAHGLAIEGRLSPTELEVPAGLRVAVIGPNGSGKTSLLRALAGVEATAGTVTIDGERFDQAPPARRRRLLGFLPASRDLHWPVAVRDLVALGVDRPDEARVDVLLSLFELEDLADRPADRLSTGERARVLMARAISNRPSALLLDEPLANLDPYWALRFLDIIAKQSERGAAVVAALHDLQHLGRFDRVLLVAGGRILNDETPDSLLASPAFEKAFRVARHGNAFEISPPTADRRSLP